jgi:CRISPR-associated protein Cas2
MKTIVSYDVATTDPTGPARLRKVAKACKSYGVRVQYSVFECSLTEKEWLMLRNKLLGIIDVTLDSVRVYFLETSWSRPKTPPPSNRWLLVGPARIETPLRTCLPTLRISLAPCRAGAD